MHCRRAMLLVSVVLSVSLGDAKADDRFYFGMGLGGAAGSGTEVLGTDNDWSTKCDLLINPDGVETNGSCESAPPRTEWSNSVDGGSGIFTAAAMGYRWRNLRIEGEYFYRITTYADRSPTRIGDEVTLGKAEQEIQTAEGGIDDIASHNLFANLYYDFRSGSRVTPYLGAGVGYSRASLGYFSLWKRHDNPEFIKTFVDDGLKRKIAGTTTLGQATLSDSMLGYQLLGGADFGIGEKVTVGVKARWTNFADFEDSAEWDQLRSHESSVGRGFRVVYSVTPGTISFWAVSLEMKYHF